MARKQDWLRAAGVGLMAGAEQINKNRMLELEKTKADRLYEIQQGRLGVDREYLSLMGQRDQRTAESGSRNQQENAIESVQGRLDSIVDPDDMQIQEYIQNREAAIKSAATNMATPEELAEQLKGIENSYRSQRELSLDPSTPEGKSRIKGMNSYLNRVNNVLETGNRKLKRAFGKDWTGSVADYLYLSPEATDAFQTGPEDEDFRAVQRGDEFGDEFGGEQPPPVEGESGLQEFMYGSSAPSAVPGEARQLGREFGLLSAEGAGELGRKIYGGGAFDPYFKGISAVAEGYQKYIGGPFERALMGDSRYRDSAPTRRLQTDPTTGAIVPPAPGR